MTALSAKHCIDFLTAMQQLKVCQGGTASTIEVGMWPAVPRLAQVVAGATAAALPPHPRR